MRFTKLDYKGYEQYLKYYEPFNEGHLYHFIFPNGLGLSVIKHKNSYGGNLNLFEAMIMKECSAGYQLKGEPVGDMTNKQVINWLECLRKQ